MKLKCNPTKERGFHLIAQKSLSSILVVFEGRNKKMNLQNDIQHHLEGSKLKNVSSTFFNTSLLVKID